MRSEICELWESWYVKVFMNEGTEDRDEAKSKT
jgi:hypothetical protein